MRSCCLSGRFGEAGNGIFSLSGSDLPALLLGLLSPTRGFHQAIYVSDMSNRKVQTHLSPEKWQRLHAVLGAKGENRYHFAKRAILKEIERLEAELGWG